MIEPPNLLMFASVYGGSEAKVTDMSIQDVPFEVPHINAMHRQIRNQWTRIAGRHLIGACFSLGTFSSIRPSNESKRYREFRVYR